MRKTAIIIVIILQVFVLAYMAAERESVVKTGTKIFLRTTPVDPRDLFRGDYVRLHYEISSIPASLIKNVSGSKSTGERGRKVYVILKEGQNGLYEADYATYVKPAHGLFIRGREGYTTDDTLTLQYGIESFYVEQGSGRKLEQSQRMGNAIQAPLEMEVAVGKDGTSVLTGYRWNPLGIGIEPIKDTSQQDAAGDKSPRMRLTVMNMSASSIALVNLPNMCSFKLEEVSRNPGYATSIFSGCDNIRPSGQDVILLEPNGRVFFDFNLGDNRWQVMDKMKITQIGLLESYRRYRIVYTPPLQKDCIGLTHASIIYRNKLFSAPFNGQRNN